MYGSNFKSGNPFGGGGMGGFSGWNNKHTENFGGGGGWINGKTSGGYAGPGGGFGGFGGINVSPTPGAGLGGMGGFGNGVSHPIAPLAPPLGGPGPTYPNPMNPQAPNPNGYQPPNPGGPMGNPGEVYNPMAPYGGGASNQPAPIGGMPTGFAQGDGLLGNFNKFAPAGRWR